MNSVLNAVVATMWRSQSRQATQRALLHAIAATPTLVMYATSDTDAYRWRRFALGLILWNLSPSLVAIVLAAANCGRLALGFLLGYALAAVTAYCTVVLSPSSSTSALLYLFLPAYVAFGFGPAGMLAVTVVHRLSSRPGKAPDETLEEERPESR